MADYCSILFIKDIRIDLGIEPNEKVNCTLPLAKRSKNRLVNLSNILANSLILLYSFKKCNSFLCMYKFDSNSRGKKKETIDSLSAIAIAFQNLVYRTTDLTNGVIRFVDKFSRLSLGIIRDLIEQTSEITIGRL